MNILIVEDNKNSSYLLRQLLENGGHAVWSADSGRSALSLMDERGLPDLIVSDALMPRMDGFELCHKLRADPERCGVPFVIYTATFTEKSDEEFAAEVGADCYLIKPFDPERLVERLEQVVAKVKSSPERKPVTRVSADHFFEGHSRRMSVKLEAKVDELSATNAALAASESEVRQLNTRLVQTVRELEGQIAERKRNEEKIRLAQSLAAMGSFGFDFNRGTSWWTPEALELLDAPPEAEELTWAELVEKIPTDIRAEAAAVFAPESNESGACEVEFTLNPANAEPRVLIARSEYYSDRVTGHSGRIAVVRDISLRRNAEADRSKLERRLRQAQKMEAIGNLAGGIAHDFNNILAVIFATSELLEIDAKEEGLPQRWVEGMHDIKDSARRARDLVGQILLFSRNESAKREAVDLKKIVAETERQIRVTLPSTMQLEVEIKTDQRLSANITQVHQILLNLCANARHAIGNRSGSIRISAENEHVNEARAARRPPLTPGDYVRIDVSDDGCGMDEETLQRVFEPFFTTKSAGEGTGLGLAVVHGIMSSHEGAIFAESTPGFGTRFTLYFPSANSDASSNQDSASLPRSGNGQHLLVVDDEPGVAKVATSLLVRLGYTVDTFTDPQDARDTVLANPGKYAMVLTDYLMPMLTGLDLAKDIWEKAPDLPIVMVVGFGGQMDASRALSQGFKGFVSKPFTLQSLAEAVEHGLKPDSG